MNKYVGHMESVESSHQVVLRGTGDTPPDGEYVLYKDHKKAIAAAVEQERAEILNVLDSIRHSGKEQEIAGTDWSPFVDGITRAGVEINRRGPSRDYRSLCQRMAEYIRRSRALFIATPMDVKWASDGNDLVKEFEEMER